MPDKPLTVFTYAASASLAAAALVYFFHPGYVFDGETSNSSASSRKRGIIGLHNPANDCFINCVLQAVAGLGDLRIYLIREIHRRDLVDPEIYDAIPDVDSNGKPVKPQRLRSMQKGDVTKGLKDMIDRLNEKPLSRKTISAGPFIRVLEHAFGSTISKTQQDAQEFLQLLAERLSEEYHAGAKARRRFANGGKEPEKTAAENAEDEKSVNDAEVGLSVEGKTETIVECEHCHFIPKSKPTSFVMLNLMVPQKSSSTLNECFDLHFKREFIDDYKCDKCRLVYAIETYTQQIQKSKSEMERSDLEFQKRLAEEALQNDPESPSEHLKIPSTSNAPKRKISRHVEITSFPKILIIHLSRSIYERNSYSMKNSARVTFPERFPLGGIVNQRHYRLLAVITHKGTHNSGHYETFRRQHVHPPVSNPNADQALGPYSVQSTPIPTPHPTPNVEPADISEYGKGASTEKSSSESEIVPSPATSGARSRPSTDPSTAPEDLPDKSEMPQTQVAPTVSTKSEKVQKTESKTASSLTPPTSKQSHRQSPSTQTSSPRLKKKNKSSPDRWWRISDDKIKESKTSEVLGMTREVYILFYEME